MSPLTGEQILVVGAGGIFDGRGLAAALSMGCSGVWVGTRFVASEEAGAGPYHKRSIVAADYTDTVRTTIYTGRPMRVFKTPYVMDWQENRVQERLELESKGIMASTVDAEKGMKLRIVLTQAEKRKGVILSTKETLERSVRLSGQAAGAIAGIKPAREIVEGMVEQAAAQLRAASSLVAKL
jgi:NAD(P)H-dependent flavin oxidoreductase YrpB (nitropropane dioxygenase family)